MPRTKRTPLYVGDPTGGGGAVASVGGGEMTAHDLTGAFHIEAGLTAGHFLKATGSAAFGFGAHGLTYSDVGAAAAGHNHSGVYSPVGHDHSGTYEPVIAAPGADPTLKYWRGDKSWQTLNQAAVAGLTTASSPAFVTVKLSGLTDGYIPYHVNNSTGLADSTIYTDGTIVQIGATKKVKLIPDYAGGGELLSGVIYTTEGSGQSLNIYASENATDKTVVIGYWDGGQTRSALEITSAAAANLLLMKSKGSVLIGATAAIGSEKFRVDGDVYVDHTQYIGEHHYPVTNYTSNIGSLSKKFLTLHAAELWVETLVAQNTIATIGGRVLVAPTTLLVADLTDSATTIHVKHNNLASGDRIYMEADGKVEFMSVDSVAGGSAGDYTYTVTRNLDGSGANVWYAGDAILNTGTTGDGFIDLYSIRGIKAATEYGPTIVGNVRVGTTYNQWEPRWAVGNLNGLYDYALNKYGFAAGQYAETWVAIDESNGFRVMHGSTVKTQIDASGNASFTGSITAASGAIGGWVISATDLKDVAGVVGMSSAVTGGDDIRFWAGHVTPGSAPFRVTEAGALTATSATITGAITANTGYIGGTGGWVIDTSLIKATNARIYSDGTEGYISFGTTPPTSYGNNVGAWLGSSAVAGGKFSLYKDSSNYLQWDGSNLTVKSPTVTISSTGVEVATHASAYTGANSYKFSNDWTAGQTGLYSYKPTSAARYLGMVNTSTDAVGAWSEIVSQAKTVGAVTHTARITVYAEGVSGSSEITGNAGSHYWYNGATKMMELSSGILSALSGLAVVTASAPSAGTDMFQMYSADQSAGNACPHFRTEGGAIIKLYQQAHLVDAYVSYGASLDAFDEVAAALNETNTLLNSVLARLENLGLSAAA
jgi:hypothetical protein